MEGADAAAWPAISVDEDVSARTRKGEAVLNVLGQVLCDGGPLPVDIAVGDGAFEAVDDEQCVGLVPSKSHDPTCPPQWTHRTQDSLLTTTDARCLADRSNSRKAVSPLR